MCFVLSHLSLHFSNIFQRIGKAFHIYLLERNLMQHHIWLYLTAYSIWWLISCCSFSKPLFKLKPLCVQRIVSYGRNDVDKTWREIFNREKAQRILSTASSLKRRWLVWIMWEKKIHLRKLNLRLLSRETSLRLQFSCERFTSVVFSNISERPWNLS